MNDLLQFTSDRQPLFRWFALKPLVEEVVDSVRPQLDAQGIDVMCDVPQGTQIPADRDMLRRALLNLVFNAMEVMSDGGSLDLSAYDNGSGVELEVADSGPGLNDHTRRHLFEPFFTTKAGGTGLGLTIVERIVEAHGGMIQAMNCPQGGAAFILVFPRKAMEAAA